MICTVHCLRHGAPSGSRVLVPAAASCSCCWHKPEACSHTSAHATQPGTASTALQPPPDTHFSPPSQVVACPSFADAAPALLAFLAGADLHGYNAIKYDVPLLAAEFSRCGTTFPEPGTKVCVRSGGGGGVAGWCSVLPGVWVACAAWLGLAQQRRRAYIASVGAGMATPGLERWQYTNAVPAPPASAQHVAS